MSYIESDFYKHEDGGTYAQFLREGIALSHLLSVEIQHRSQGIAMEFMTGTDRAISLLISA